MVEIFITKKDIEKYVYMLVVFNAVFPGLIEECGVVINLKENEYSENIIQMPYEYFISEFDCLGLNEIAE